MAWRPDYLTLTAGKDWLRVPADDTTDDVYVSTLITAASRAIDGKCHRQFGKVTGATTLTYDPVNAVPMLRTRRWRIPIDDVHDPADLTVDGVALGVGDYVLGPTDAEMNGVPYRWLELTARPVAPIPVRTAGFGWAEVPAGVVAAARLQLNRWFTRRESPYGVAGSPTEGSETRLSARLDVDVATTLSGGLCRARWRR